MTIRPSILVAGLAIVIVAAADYGLWHARRAVPAATVADVQQVAAPSEQPTFYDDALRARLAILSGDYTAADAIIDGVVKASGIGPFRYYPFEPFLDAMVAKRDESFRHALDKWIAKENSGTAYLTRAWYLHEYGWSVRGHGYIDGVSKANAEIFNASVQQWMADSLEAIHLRPDIPFSWLLLMKGTTDTGAEPLRLRTFKEATAKFPNYYPLYDERLGQLEPKWGGSFPAMYEFVAGTIRSVPKNAPIRMLQLGFIREFLDSADAACPGSGTVRALCFRAIANSLGEDKLKASIHDALEAYTGSDPYEFNEYFIKVLAEMTHYEDEQDLGDFILQDAKPILGPDNYALNFTTAYMAYLKNKDYRNSAALYLRALHDISVFDFPDSGARARRGAAALDYLASVYEKEDLPNALTMDDRAVLLDDTYAEAFQNRCYVEFNLNRFDDAVRDCTRSIELQDDNPYAEFYRAMAYGSLKQMDKSVTDFVKVMQFNWHNPGIMRVAMQNVASAYFQTGRDQEAVDLYALHPEMFDPVDPVIASQSYNNVCYGQMQLHLYPQALENCRKSLALHYTQMAADKKNQLEKLIGATPK